MGTTILGHVAHHVCLCSLETSSPFFQTDVLAMHAQTSPRESVFVLVLHHLIADGWSIGVILADLMAAYNKAVQSTPGAPITAAQPSELPLQYTAYSAWMHSALRDGILAPKVLYWEKRLKGGRLLELPADNGVPRSGARGTNFADVLISADIARAVDEFSVNMGTSTFVVVMAAFQVSLISYRCVTLIDA